MPTFRAAADVPMLSDLLRALGGVPARRICMDPPPGRADVRDLARLNDRHNLLFELVDRTLVRKATGYVKSHTGVQVAGMLWDWNNRAGRPGVVVGVGVAFRLRPGLIRLPDVSFTSWDQFPNRKLPRVGYLEVAPDLAAEVLSPGNTRREMERKLKEYFLAGARLVWFIDPETRTARAFTSPDSVTEVPATGGLDGGDVLPGFRVPVAALFTDLDDEPPAPAKQAPKKKR